MSHAFELSDEQYELIRRLAQEDGRTPEDLFVAWTAEVEERYRRDHPAYYETDAWLRHLGATDEQIREGERLAAMPDDDEEETADSGKAS